MKCNYRFSKFSNWRLPFCASKKLGRLTKTMKKYFTWNPSISLFRMRYHLTNIKHFPFRSGCVWRLIFGKFCVMNPQNFIPTCSFCNGWLKYTPIFHELLNEKKLEQNVSVVSWEFELVSWRYFPLLWFIFDLFFSFNWLMVTSQT